VRNQRRWRAFRRALDELGRRATEHLSEGHRRFSVEYTPADLSYLRQRARPSAFTWDIRRHGRVLHGRRELLDEIPAFDVSAIPPEDSMETLMNRGLELLAVRNGEGGAEDRAYAVAKAVLDAAGSALAFDGAFESRVARRPQAFGQLLRRRGELVRLLDDSEHLRAFIDRAARAKLCPSTRALEELSDPADVDRVLRWIAQLWVWESGHSLDHPDADLSELVRAYLAREGWADRLRGWAKYAWHPLRPSTAPLRPRLMMHAWSGSPRRLVYAAALQAIEGGRNWPERAARLLPVVRAERGRMLPQILETWTWLVRNN
jgi:hypothetical protein